MRSPGGHAPLLTQGCGLSRHTCGRSDGQGPTKVPRIQSGHGRSIGFSESPSRQVSSCSYWHSIGASQKPLNLLPLNPHQRICERGARDSRSFSIHHSATARSKLSSHFFGRTLPSHRHISTQKSSKILSQPARSSLDIFSGAQTALAGAYAALTLTGGLFEGFGGLESFGGWDVGIVTATGVSAGALAAWALAHSRGPSEVHESPPQGELISAAENEFNRFVLTRSPRLGHLGKNTLAKASDTRSAKPVPRSGGELESETKYRRHCVRLSDGGHLALDWPAHLAIQEGDGRESVVLIVPGTVAGSLDEGVKMLVRKAADSGHFPVVVNQRGFAQSPVTTPK